MQDLDNREKETSQEFYHDEKQDSVNALKEAADRIRVENYEEQLGVKDVALDILSVALWFVIGFAWMMLMLLMISFVSLSYIHFNIKTMVIVSILTGLACGFLKLFKTVPRYLTRRH